MVPPLLRRCRKENGLTPGSSLIFISDVRRWPRPMGYRHDHPRTEYSRLCGNSNGANLEERAGTVHSRTPCPLRRWHALAVGRFLFICSRRAPPCPRCSVSLVRKRNQRLVFKGWPLTSYSILRLPSVTDEWVQSGVSINSFYKLLI